MTEDGADDPKASRDRRSRLTSPRFLIALACSLAFLLILAASLRRVRQRRRDREAQTTGHFAPAPP